MKKNHLLFWVSISFFILIFVSSVVSQPCLKLWDGGSPYSENPDSMQIDTCPDPGTNPCLFAKRAYAIFFNENILPRNYTAPKDTIIEYSWKDFDSSYINLRLGFEAFEEKYGNFTFREQHPHLPDTMTFRKRSLLLYLDDYACIDSVINDINQIDQVQYSGYIQRWHYDNSFYDDEDRKNDCIVPYFRKYNGGWLNPDSVMINRCYFDPDSSRLLLYAKKMFVIEFEGNIIPRPYLAPQDTIIEYSIGDIDSSFSSLKNNLYDLEQRFGSFTLRERRPNTPDTTPERSRRLLLIHFDNYVSIDTVIIAFNSIDLIPVMDYIQRYGLLVSITDLHDPNNLKSYPNPVRKFINVEIMEEYFFGEKISVYNSIGLLLGEYTLNSNQIKIDFSSYQNGIYFLVYKGASYKIIKY